MKITQKRTVDKQLLGHAQKRMDAQKEYSYREMMKLAEKRKAVGARKGEGRTGGLHKGIVYSLVAQYGPEIMTAAGNEFWNDLKRENPWMCADGNVPGTDSINGHRNRIGNVKDRYSHGQWWHWDKQLGSWLPGESMKRKGIR